MFIRPFLLAFLFLLGLCLKPLGGDHSASSSNYANFLLHSNDLIAPQLNLKVFSSADNKHSFFWFFWQNSEYFSDEAKALNFFYYAKSFKTVCLNSNKSRAPPQFT